MTAVFDEVAASMISGLDVAVSFRTTHHGSGGRSYNGQPMELSDMIQELTSSNILRTCA